VRKAERAWFLSEGEESEALIRVAFDSLGLSSMVAATISQNLCPEHSYQLSRKWRCLHLYLIIGIVESII